MPKVTVVPPQVRYRFEAECKRHGMTVNSAMRAYNRGMDRETRQLKRDHECRQLHTLQWALSYLTEGREHSDVDARKRVMQWTGKGERSAIAWVKGERPTPEYAVMLILEGIADMIDNAKFDDERKAYEQAQEQGVDLELLRAANFPDMCPPLPRDERETFREAYRDAFRLLIMGAYPHEDEDDDRLRAYYFLARASAPRIRALIAFLDAMDPKAVPHWDRSDQEKELWETQAMAEATSDLRVLGDRVESRHPNRDIELVRSCMQELGLPFPE